MMSAHSVIPPSSAAIWGAPNGCTGWPAMAALYPEKEESEAARAGTASHEVAANMITASARGNAGYPRREDTIGSQASNGVVITEDMYDGADLYAEDVRSVMERLRNYSPQVECRVEAPRVHAQSWGSVDCSLYNAPTNDLYIWDYKFGYGVVEAFENWQAINYVAGILDMLGIDGTTDRITTVHIRIAQPRAFHSRGPIREWKITAADLRPYINTLSNNAREALGPNAKLRSGSHCRYCRARHACPAAVSAGMAMFEAVNVPIPAELTPEQLGAQLALVMRGRKQLEYLESAYEEQAMSLIRHGSVVPGWMVEQGVGKRKWAKPPEEVFALGDLMGVDLREEPKPVTPAQAEKKGLDKTVVAAYVTKNKTGLKLVPDNNNKAKEIFS